MQRPQCVNMWCTFIAVVQCTVWQQLEGKASKMSTWNTACHWRVTCMGWELLSDRDNYLHWVKRTSQNRASFLDEPVQFLPIPSRPHHKTWTIPPQRLRSSGALPAPFQKTSLLQIQPSLSFCVDVHSVVTPDPFINQITYMSQLS